MKKTFKVGYFAIFLAVTILVMGVCLMPLGLTSRLELLAQDLFFNTRGTLKPGNEVVIATIDEKSIDKLGRWPWKRSVLAELVDRLKEYGVKVIGFDIVFSSPETSQGTDELLKIEKHIEETGLQDDALREIVGSAVKNSDNDLKLYKALKRSKKAVLGYFFHFSRQGLEHLSEPEMESYLKIIARSRYSGVKKQPDTSLHDIPLKRAFAVEATIAKISKATKRAGYFNFDPDVDGSVRKVPLIVQYRDMVELEGQDDYLFPPLSMTVLRKYLKSAVIIWIGPTGVEKVALMGRKNYLIPTNSIGEMRINYYGPGGTFPHYSIVDIIKGEIPSEKLKGKIVMVGPTATAIEDLRITPFDKVFPGVEVHATIIDNVLHGRFLSDPQTPSILIDLLSILGAGILLFLFIPRLGAVSGGALAGLLAFASVGVHYYIFSRHQVVLSAVPPLLETGAMYVSLAIYRFISEEKEKRYIQGAFGQYLSPAIIDELVKDPSRLQLGGVRREMTAFFSDVAGFSSISENLTPEELVHLLNDYLTDMTEIILKYHGTVDKYEGDAIIAFFGAPMDDPEHSLKCCLAAIDMQTRLVEMREAWKKEGKAELTVRVGINTGPMVVGNMGSKTRMDYTMMGDAVNLASRLEGANKQYGSYSMISHSTYSACRDSIEVRELDALRVVGKQEVVVVYELLGRKGDVDLEQMKLINLYNQGLEFYKAREWKQAIDVFSNILEMDVNDGPSLTYLERCLDFYIKPPAKDWDGVYVMKTK